MHFEEYVMEKVILNEVTRCDRDTTEIQFTVRGRKVTALFPATSNTRAYLHIKRILIGVYLENNFSTNSHSF